MMGFLMMVRDTGDEAGIANVSFRSSNIRVGGERERNRTEGTAIPVAQGAPCVLIPAILRAGITPLSAMVCSPDEVA